MIFFYFIHRFERVNIYILKKILFKLGRNICFNLINRQDGTFLSNSGTVVKDSNVKSLEYYGGLKNIIPFFNMIKFCEYDKNNDILKNLI